MRGPSPRSFAGRRGSNSEVFVGAFYASKIEMKTLIGALRVSALGLFIFSLLGVFGHLGPASRLIERQPIAFEPFI